MNTAHHYARIRRERPNTAAAHAYRWAQQEAEIDALEAEAEYRDAPGLQGNVIMVARGLELTVEWDTEPYDWGDVEPTQYDVDHLEVIVVSARATAGDLPGVDCIGGIGFLPDTTAEREAWRVALDSGWFEQAAEINGEHDAFERAAAEYAGEWFARRASAGGGFVDALFDLCAVADTAALERLMVAFPELVGAWRARKGA